MKRSRIKLFSLLFVVCFIVVACGPKIGKAELKESVLSYLSSTDDLLYYGYIDYLHIKNQSELQDIPGVGAFIQNKLTAIESAIDVSKPIYFAMSDVQNEVDIPNNSTFFFAVKDKDALAHVLEDLGLMRNEKSNLFLYGNNGLSIGFTDDIGVIAYDESGSNLEGEIIQTFATIEKGASKKEFEEVLSKKADLIVASPIINVFQYLTHSDLPFATTKYSDFLEKIKITQGVTTVQFNDGEISIQSELVFMNGDVQKHLDQIFSKKNASIINYLGPNTPSSAFTCSVDVVAIENFIESHLMEKEQLKSGLQMFYRSYGDKGALIESIAKGKLTTIWDGVFGMSMNLSPELSKENGEESLTRYYVGLGTEKQNIHDLIGSLAKGNKLQNYGDNFYGMGEESILKVEENFLLIQDKIGGQKTFEVGKMDVNQLSEFGAQPISFYFKPTEDGKEFNYLGYPAFNVLTPIVDIVTLNMNSRKMEIKIQFKNKKENSLKQLKDKLERGIVNMSSYEF